MKFHPTHTQPRYFQTPIKSQSGQLLVKQYSKFPTYFNLTRSRYLPEHGYSTTGIVRNRRNKNKKLICFLQGSTVKMEAVCSSEMLAVTYRPTTLSHIPEDHNRRLSC